MNSTGEPPMKPEKNSERLLGVTRAKAKMYEYNVPPEYHIEIRENPEKLFTLAIGLLGDMTARMNRGESNTSDFIELKKHLSFSAYFFDSFFQSKLNEILTPYLQLLGAAAYYLCELPGSSLVLLNNLKENYFDLEADGLEHLIFWLIKGDYTKRIDGKSEYFGECITNIEKWTLQYFRTGVGEDRLIEAGKQLRVAVYDFGTPRQLLFGDIIATIIKKKIINSTWKSLPLYSGLSIEQWRPAIIKSNSIKELWPAQHLIGEKGVFKGASAIIQMPTSAGKTKATELIIRSAFLSKRITLAVIVAPFRALCHEIKNNLFIAFRNEAVNIDELSDTFQSDFILSDMLQQQQILVVTPEKLLYVLRHEPELGSYIGLLIFDEGHQFDSGSRGVTYELLLTSLRSMLIQDTQKILISAVVSNAKEIGEWLNRTTNVVEGTNLVPTFKTIGFVSWLDLRGRIQYVDPKNTVLDGFFVPRVIESIDLGNNVIFPDKSDGKSIALYLGLKLVPNGGIAIFCGKKSVVKSICEKTKKILETNISLPLMSSNHDEVTRLKDLIGFNLGNESPYAKSAEYGIFPHHGNTPQGIKLAVEYAMHENFYNIFKND
ncbi:MAG: DEAD/DEAH box helicase [Prevotella sp.]|jgi:hypothetical protein|nr:DEAD/DEAH box helicase [Prevotella sp.]